MNMVIPNVTRVTTTYLCRANARRYKRTFITMTGTSLQDLASTIAGYEIWASAAKPNGAAKVMRREHWKYLNKRDFVIGRLGGVDAWPFDLALGTPFEALDLGLMYTSGGERPRSSEKV